MNKHELKSLLENIYHLLAEEGEFDIPSDIPLDRNGRPIPYLWSDRPQLPPKPPVPPTITPYDPVVLDPSSIPKLLRRFYFPLTIPEDITNDGLRDWFRTLNWGDWIRIWVWYKLQIRPTLSPDMQKQVDEWVRQFRS